MAQSGKLSDLKSLIGNSIVYGLGNILLKAITFLLLPLYTRFLTTADYGVIAVTNTITAVLCILYPMGLHGALTRLYFDAENQVERRQSTGTIWLAMMLGAISMTVFLDRMGSSMFPLLLREVAFRPYIRLAIWIAFFQTFSLLPLNLFQIQERPKLYVLTTAMSTLLTIGIIIQLVVFQRQGAYGYLFGMFLASAVLVVPYIFLTLRNIKITVRNDILKKVVVYSLPLVAHGLAGWVLELSDRVILERFVSMEALGLYSIGYQFGSIITIVATAINYAWVPFFFRVDAQEGEAGKPRLASLATYYMAVLTWAALGLALLAKHVLFLLTAPSYHAGYRVIPWIIGGLFLSGLYYIPANCLFLKSKTGWIPIVTVISGIVNVCLNLMWVPRYGIMAAAWATFLAYGVMLGLVWVSSQRIYSFPYEYKRLGQIILVGIILLITGYSLSFNSMLIEVLVRLAVWLTFPVILLAIGFFNIGGGEKGRAIIKQLLASTFKKVQSERSHE